MSKVLVVTNNTTGSVNQYANVSTAGNTLVTFSASVVGGSLLLQGTTTNNNTVIRLKKLYQTI